MIKLLKYFLWMLTLVGIFSCGKNDDDGTGEGNPTIEDGFTIGDQIITDYTAKAYRSEDGMLIKIDFDTDEELFIVCANATVQEYTFIDNLAFNSSSNAFATISTGLSAFSTDGAITLSIDENSLDIEFNINFGLLSELKNGKISNIKIEEQAYTDFTEISLTDENGQALGSVDDTDWKNKENWNRLEHALFPSNFGIPISIFDTLEVFDAYPNPCKDVFSITFKANQTTQKLEFVFVNTNFEILHRGMIDSGSFAVGFNNVNFNIEATPELAGISAEEYFRMYYTISFENSHFRGHGDLRKAP